MTLQEYSIQDLCDQTGLPRRTIHFYTQQDIIPPPVSSGLGARYQHVHLVRLKLIPVLRQQGLRLDDIRQKFSTATSEELETLLAGSEIRPYGAVPQPKPGVNGSSTLVPQVCQTYNLPHGVIVLVPENLSKELLSKVERICRILERELAQT
jgi:DNA-binding transcriptional MerR regulator